MRKNLIFILMLGLICLSAACGMRTDPSATNEHNTSSLTTRIKITAGETVMYANMKDNPTAQEFVELLPLTLDAFDRIGLVKSTVLPQSISDDTERTRKYELGSIFYWPEGNEVAFCYSDHLPETVVDIIHIGIIESGFENFETYAGDILVELTDIEPEQTE